MGYSHGVVEGGATRAVVNLRFIYAFRDCPCELVARDGSLGEHEGRTTAIRGAVRIEVAEVGSGDTISGVENDANYPARGRNAARPANCGWSGSGRGATTVVGAIPGCGLGPPFSALRAEFKIWLADHLG